MSASSRVHHLDAQITKVHSSGALLARFAELLAELRLEERFGERDKIAVKMHVGAEGSYTTVHPQFVRALTKRFESRDNFLFITDTHHAVRTAWQRGYTHETTGAMLLPVSGVVDRYYEEIQVSDSQYFSSIKVAGNIAHADGLIVLSHAKGHASCGFGGAIKNVGIGCVVQETRNHIHTFEGVSSWHEDQDPHSVGNTTLNLDRGHAFSEALAQSAHVVLSTFHPSKVICVNVALNVHPYCDCWGLSGPSMISDLGLYIGQDPADVDAAVIDAIGRAHVTEHALPSWLKHATGGGAPDSLHPLERIHKRDPWHQVYAFRKLASSGLYAGHSRTS